MDPEGRERWRVEGYLPRRDFRVELEMGLARVAVMAKRWEDAQARYQRIVDEYGDARRAPEALYWRYTSEYSRTHDHHVLQEAWRQLHERYPGSEEAVKASVWAG